MRVQAKGQRLTAVSFCTDFNFMNKQRDRDHIVGELLFLTNNVIFQTCLVNHCSDEGSLWATFRDLGGARKLSSGILM